MTSILENIVLDEEKYGKVFYWNNGIYFDNKRKIGNFWIRVLETDCK